MDSNPTCRLTGKRRRRTVRLLIVVWMAAAWIGTVSAASYYVATTGADTNDGSIGHPFRTVQRGVNALGSGDTLYLRGGVYSEYVKIPNGKQSQPGTVITMRSYPGEWAVINGGHQQALPVIYYHSGSQTYCPIRWVFRNFEVTGGGTANGTCFGGGISLWTAAYVTFMYLYIHDNYGGGSENDAGIVIRNDAQAAQFITIKYCYLKNNCDPNNHNCANISFFSDYVSTPTAVTNINNTRHKNEIAYNLLEGSCMGIKSKAEQYLSLDNTGNHTTYKEYGDKIHHNIIRYHQDEGISARQDFIQVYNNIIESTTSHIGIALGSSHYDTEREPFYACAYNNLLKGVDGRLEHSTDAIYGPPLHPHVFWYNNIFESVGAPHDGCNDLNLFFTWGSLPESSLQMNTVAVEKNLFHPRSRTDAVINLGNASNDLSVNAYIARPYATTLYANSTSGLYLGGSGYLCNPQFVLDISVTIQNGGVGIPHPYLAGVSIPAYVGPADPSDNQWVNGVLGLTSTAYLASQTGDAQPSWIEGGAITAPGNLRVIDK